MKFFEFCKNLDERTSQKGNRCGAVAYNYLSSIRPDLIDRVTNTTHDPFYCTSTSDEKWKLFIKFLNENWY